MNFEDLSSQFMYASKGWWLTIINVKYYTFMEETIAIAQKGKELAEKAFLQERVWNFYRPRSKTEI